MVTVVMPEGLGGAVESLKSFPSERAPDRSGRKPNFSQFFKIFCGDL
jgi:hypothetical protein